MSHHSSDYDEQMKKAAEQFYNNFSNLGPTGNFPHGKLTENDEGEIAFAVGRKNGKVVINFNSPVHWLGMIPSQAKELGRLLIKHSKKIEKCPK